MNTGTLLQLCRIGYITILLLLTGWFVNKNINGYYSIAFSLLWILPLLLPIKGVLQGNPYTYAWGSFILCLYLLHGLTLIYVDNQVTLFAAIEILLLLFLVVGFSFFARLKSRELKLKHKLDINNK